MRVELTHWFENMNLETSLPPELQAKVDRRNRLTREIKQKTGETDAPISSIVRYGINAQKSDDEIRQVTIAGIRKGRNWIAISIKLETGEYPTDEELQAMKEESERRRRKGPSREQRIVQEVLAGLHPCDG